MFKALLKLRISYVWKSMFGRMQRTAQKRSKLRIALFAILAIYVICAVLFLFGTLFSSLANAFIPQNFAWLYFAMIAIMCLGLNFIGSIFTVYGQLFDAQDNELLFSMPIPPRMIMASRLFSILLINILMSLLVLLPGYIIYAIYAPIQPTNIVFFILSIILLPLLTTTISCLFGWIVGLVVSRVRHKNLITTIMLLVCFFAYFYFFSNIQGYINTLVQNGAEIATAIRQYLPPIYHFSVALADESLVSFLIFLLWCVMPFSLVYLLLSKSFIKIATTKKATKKVQYKHQALATSSVRKSLLKKELTRFFSLPMYIFNSGVGAILLLLLAGAILLRGDAILGILGVSGSWMQIMPILLCIVIGFCAVTILTSACSLSLEGSSFWILRTHPVAYRDVMYAKIITNLIVSYPAIIIAAAASWFRFGFSLTEGILVLLIPLLLTTATAQFGFITNLRYPRFEWVSETVVIKQSGSVILTMLFGLALLLLPVLLYVLIFNRFLAVLTYMAAIAVVYVLVNFLLQLYLRGKGERIYESISV